MQKPSLPLEHRLFVSQRYGGGAGEEGEGGVRLLQVRSSQIMPQHILGREIVEA